MSIRVTKFSNELGAIRGHRAPTPPASTDAISTVPDPRLLRTFPFFLIRPVLRVGPMSASPRQRDQHHYWDEIGDPVADALAARMKQPDGAAVRADFERAIENGLGSISDPVPELVEFIESMEFVPYWVDFEQINRGASAISRVGWLILPAFIVGLSASYSAPQANEVLLRSGDLHESAAKRAVETFEWFCAVTRPDGLRRNGDGFKSTARVRLTHAFIRSGIARRDDWNDSGYGLPINQSIYVVTSILFSTVSIVAAMALGNPLTRGDRAAIYHMWRYISFLVGVDPRLIPADERDMWRLTWIAVDHQVDFVDSGQVLGTALLDALPQIYGIEGSGPRARIAQTLLRQAHSDLSNFMLGNFFSRGVGYGGRSAITLAIVPFAAANLAVNCVARVVPGLSRWQLRHALERNDALREKLRRRTSADVSFTRQ